ncbi:carbohydrate-binding module family 21 protein [Paxillus rubicundulus Ve08.2h10]|uniref:Carbohydrate-binding module family 21 protein n=1 Tax=Paxillus rubicundulus Ve08.2h10 TaxID=930991 RepID=A0A0D0DTN8_9AGAM|nr:carbohydrate-binding module family 21 protein [Paxillus rubicundulus Ve08.2h10]
MSSTVCMTDTSMIPFPTADSTYTQTSNTAARPLPHIPRRNSHLGHARSRSESALSDLNLSPPSAAFSGETPPSQSRFPTYVRFDSESSSSSSTPSDEIRPIIIPRVPTQRSTAVDFLDTFTPITPTPTPIKPRADTPARSFADIESRKKVSLSDTSEDDTPRSQTPVCKVGKLRLEGTLGGRHIRHSSDSTVSASRVLTNPAADPQTFGSLQPRAVRKKSGEPVKSSLKSARRPNLHVVTGGTYAKSEPVTPTHFKAVHFDSKLEHVKLFLAEQKPLAVSRDGSPTTDTSGTDDFPSFIYGDVNREKQQIKMLLPNMPSSPRKDGNVTLQQLILSGDQRTITGKIRVRNIAYEKWLAVRFTLDWWQTTSEVTARYDESIEGGAFDNFSFSIRLHDIWSRIEEKTIFVAIRYTVAGKEYWDNNSGQNYHVKFVPAPSQSSSAVNNDASTITFSDLNSRLEEVAKARSIPVPVPTHRLGRSFSADHQFPSLISGKSLSSRYDFASASKSQWARPVAPPSTRHTRTHTHPSLAPRSDAQAACDVGKVTPPSRPQPAPLPALREMSSMHDTPTPPTCTEAKATPVEIPSPSRIQEGRERNHRRGQFDKVMEGSPNVRRTPTGSPLKFGLTNNGAATGQGGHLPRPYSLPLNVNSGTMGNSSLAQFTMKPPLSIQTDQIGDGGSQESTPSVASQSSSASTSSCTPLLSPGSGGASQDNTTYKQFLDQFCFYTGTDSLLQESSQTFRRSQSTSSIEQFLLSHSPPHRFLAHMRDLATFASPPRSSSFDNVDHRAGSVTPTGPGLLTSGSSPSTRVIV